MPATIKRIDIKVQPDSDADLSYLDPENDDPDLARFSRVRLEALNAGTWYPIIVYAAADIDDPEVPFDESIVSSSIGGIESDDRDSILAASHACLADLRVLLESEGFPADEIEAATPDLDPEPN